MDDLAEAKNAILAFLTIREKEGANESQIDKFVRCAATLPVHYRVDLVLKKMRENGSVVEHKKDGFWFLPKFG